MKTLFFILFFIFSFNGFSQFEANEWGFILKQYIRTIESRKQFIENNYEFSKLYFVGSTDVYLNSEYQSSKHKDFRIDSLLLMQLPTFNKLKYKITYTAEYDKFHIANKESIYIKNRFKFKSNKEIYRIVFDYTLNEFVESNNKIVMKFIYFPDLKY
jgi:hypothetical protein